MQGGGEPSSPNSVSRVHLLLPQQQLRPQPPPDRELEATSSLQSDASSSRAIKQGHRGAGANHRLLKAQLQVHTKTHSIPLS